MTRATMKNHVIILDRKGRQVGKKDTKAKAYMSDPEHFADAFNYYLFQGRKIVRPEKLEEIETLYEIQKAEAVCCIFQYAGTFAKREKNFPGMEEKQIFLQT